MITDNGDGSASASNGVTLATSARVLPDLTEASRLAAEIADEKAEAKASGKASRKASAKVSRKAEPAEDMPRGRSSQVNRYLLPLHKLLMTGPKHVDVLASKLGFPANLSHGRKVKLVRGTIDTMRKVMFPNSNLGKTKLVNRPGGMAMTFGYIAGFKQSKAVVDYITKLAK